MSYLIEIQESSYFALDRNVDITPDAFINNILESHIFELDLTTGDITPSVDGDLGSLFEIDSNGDITPKVL